MNIINLHHTNNVYLLNITLNFSYSHKPWSLFLKVRVLKSKCQFRMVYRSSSIWPGIKQFYDIILEHTSWIVGTSTSINFLNDKWCSTPSLSIIAGVPDGFRISDTISKFFTSSDCSIPLPLQQMSHFFEHIRIR